MSIGGLTTFLNITPVSILIFIMRLFLRSRPNQAPSVTPYPLAPHLPENCILDISCADASTHYDGRGVDLEKGVRSVSYTCPAAPAVHQATYSNAFRNSGDASKSVSDPQVPNRNVSLIPGVVPHPFFGPVLKPSSTAKQKPRTPQPRSIPRNFARITGSPRTIIPSKTWIENNNPNAVHTLQKDHSPRRKSRYLNLSPKKSSATRTFPDETSISWRQADRDAHETFSASCGDEVATPLKLERILPDESVDWAARIRSVFYKNREVDEDLAKSVRELFSRDSGASSMVDDSLGIIKAGDLLDDDNDDSTWYSFSSEDSSSDSSSAPTSSPLPCSRSSELPYLRDTHPSLSVSSSASSGAFNDLLASAERKYPGRRWRDIVKFSTDDQDEGYQGVSWYNGIAEGEKQQWSDVLCIDEYAH